MKLTRYLKPAQVKLELATTDPPEIPEGANPQKIRAMTKESVLREIADLFASSGMVANKSKLFTDLVNRERKASTAIGNGIAVPHVRTMQARQFIIAFARSTLGVDFDSADGKPAHLFFAVVAPPYNDDLYLKVYREMALIFGKEEKVSLLMAAKSEHEVIKIVSNFE